MFIPTNRLEVFSDGILSIAITMMVLEMRAPEMEDMTATTQWTVFSNALPLFLIYVLSFAMLTIVWIGHHNLYDLVKHVDVPLLWHNMHLLFWITIVPIATYFLGTYPSMSITVAGYGFTMFMLSVSILLSRRYVLVHHLLINNKEPGGHPAVYPITRRRQTVGYITTFVFFLSIVAAFIYRPAAYGSFVLPAIVYMLPARIIEAKKKKIFATIRRRRKKPCSG